MSFQKYIIFAFRFKLELFVQLFFKCQADLFSQKKKKTYEKYSLALYKFAFLECNYEFTLFFPGFLLLLFLFWFIFVFRDPKNVMKCRHDNSCYAQCKWTGPGERQPWLFLGYLLPGCGVFPFGC